MCVVKASASDLNSGNGYVVCGRKRAFGGSGFVVFVCLLLCLFSQVWNSSNWSCVTTFFRLECSRGARAGTRSKEKAQGKGWRMRSDPGPLLHSNRQSHLLRRLSASRTGFFTTKWLTKKNSSTHEVCGYSNRVLAFNEHWTDVIKTWMSTKRSQGHWN